MSKKDTAPETAPQDDLGTIVQFHVKEGIQRGANVTKTFALTRSEAIGSTSRLVCSRLEWHPVGVKVTVGKDVFVVPIGSIGAIDLKA